MAKVVYLHGIRKATERKRWLDALNDSLVQVGYTTLSDDDVIDFDYVPILARATAGTSSEPKITKWTIETEELHRCQSEYLRSMAYFRSWLDVSSARITLDTAGA